MANLWRFWFGFAFAITAALLGFSGSYTYLGKEICAKMEMETTIMDDLVGPLLSDGFNVKLKNGKIVVRLEGFSNVVSISKDIAADEYKINTNDTTLSILASFFLLFGLYGINQTSGGSFLDVALVTFSVLIFVIVILTELKVTKLRSAIDKLNSKISS